MNLNGQRGGHARFPVFHLRAGDSDSTREPYAVHDGLNFTRTPDRRTVDLAGHHTGQRHHAAARGTPTETLVTGYHSRSIAAARLVTQAVASGSGSTRRCGTTDGAADLAITWRPLRPHDRISNPDAVRADLRRLVAILRMARLRTLVPRLVSAMAVCVMGQYSHGQQEGNSRPRWRLGRHPNPVGIVGRLSARINTEPRADGDSRPSRRQCGGGGKISADSSKDRQSDYRHRIHQLILYQRAYSQREDNRDHGDQHSARKTINLKQG